MKNISITVLLLLIFYIGGCARLNFQPPKQHAFDRTMIYNDSFDAVWSGAVDWFAEHNILIDKIEKTSGLLTAKKKIKIENGLFLDCGNPDISGVMGRGKRLAAYATINLTVHSMDHEKTKLMVNLFGNYELRALDQWDGRPVSYTGDCVSTGELEKSIFAFIGKKTNE